MNLLISIYKLRICKYFWVLFRETNVITRKQFEEKEETRFCYWDSFVYIVSFINAMTLFYLDRVNSPLYLIHMKRTLMLRMHADKSIFSYSSHYLLLRKINENGAHWKYFQVLELNMSNFFLFLINWIFEAVL